MEHIHWHNRHEMDTGERHQSLKIVGYKHTAYIIKELKKNSLLIIYIYIVW